MKYTIQLIFALILSSTIAAVSQPIAVDQIVEVSGMILTRNDLNQVRPIPFATVSVQSTQRGTYANFEGMFSIVVKKGQTLKFSAVGYGDFEIKIPEDHKDLYFSIVVELEPQDINLEEVVVFPWPDRDNFRAEFLAMEPTMAMQMEDIAKENLNRQKMLEIANAMNMDSRENATMYLRQQANDYAYKGQMQPMPIFDPLAWSRFFKQLNDKKKKDKEETKQKVFGED
jgi:hypothetical protein